MRFSLQDVRKSIQRRGGSLTVSLHFLRSGDLHDELARLIAYHEALVGQPQRLFSQDEARACIGEYRLADCLIATLSFWYSWQTRPWQEALSTLGGNDTLATLSPIQLRLALYDHVNAGYQGFLTSANRQAALQTFASQFSLTVPELEYLLTLDSDNETLLKRTTPEPPTPQEVATLYNQWVFEAALFNASNVRFTIDCAAFARLNEQETLSNTSPSTILQSKITSGVGTVIKRLCYLARRLGVYYDLAYETGSPASSQSLILALSLYGPQDVTGAPQQYGLRLARLCRLLLGYTRYRNQANPSSRKKATFSGAILSAEATVHFSQRTYAFVMDANLLQLLPQTSSSESDQSSHTADPTQLFDSGIEQIFSEAFQALAIRQGADGWQLEREPEPLLLERSIFIPDFAFTRDSRRIYVEILGFWTPSYRERKIQKLLQLQGRDDLLLAIPNSAKETFLPIADLFPIVYYEDQLGVTEVLQLLRQRYDDFAQRLATLDIPTIRTYIHTHGILSEADCYTYLHCYRRSEIQQAAEKICASTERPDGSREIAFVPGLGLYHQEWLYELQSGFETWLRARGSSSLSEAVQTLKQIRPALQPCSESTLTTLLELWPTVRIQRDSIFETRIEWAVVDDTGINTSQQNQNDTEQAAISVIPKTPRKQSREKRTAPKKRPVENEETLQGNLWDL